MPSFRSSHLQLRYGPSQHWALTSKLPRKRAKRSTPGGARLILSLPEITTKHKET
jgi:hypothetical protein